MKKSVLNRADFFVIRVYYPSAYAGDFVVNRHDERLYIQSAYALPSKEKVVQEQASLLQVADGFRKIIVAGDRYTSGYNEDGILIVGLYDFLLGKFDIWKNDMKGK